VHGVTIFADLSEEEFKTNYLGYKAVTDRRGRVLKKTKDTSKMGKVAKVPKYKGKSTAVNWADTYTTGVKDQVCFSPRSECTRAHKRKTHPHTLLLTHIHSSLGLLRLVLGFLYRRAN